MGVKYITSAVTLQFRPLVWSKPKEPALYPASHLYAVEGGARLFYALAPDLVEVVVLQW